MRRLAKLLQERCLSKTSGKSSSEGVIASVLETLGLVLEAAPQVSRRCLMLVKNKFCLLARMVYWRFAAVWPHAHAL